MSSEKSGDNHLFQIVMVLITSVVAPLVVFFVTNAAKNSTPAPTATSSIAVNATVPANPPAGQPTIVSPAEATAAQPSATQPAAATIQPPTPAAQATASATKPAANPPQPNGVPNPSGLVPGGTPAIVDNFSLSISTEDIVVDGSAIRVTLHVKNLSADARTLVLTPGSITVKDDKKVYSPMFGEKKSACSRADLTMNKTITINPGATVNLTSATEKQPGDWCVADKKSVIPAFSGPISKGTTKLEIQINGVGPFKGFAFEVPIKTK